MDVEGCEIAIPRFEEYWPAESAGDTDEDHALLRRIVGRDQLAAAELYDRHKKLLFNLIFRIIRVRCDAEEILQEVLLVVWNRAETYNASWGAPVAWLVTIAKNRSIDRLRANLVRQRVAESAPLPTAVANPESSAVLSERCRAVTRALRSLPRDQRALIEEAYFLGLTQSELAVKFGLPLGTVKGRMRTGIMWLRQQLQARPIARSSPGSGGGLSATVAVTLHCADEGDTTTIVHAATAAAEPVEEAQVLVNQPPAGRDQPSRTRGIAATKR